MAAPRTNPRPAVTGTPLPGVEFLALTTRTDARGSFTEVQSDDWPLAFEPRQWSVVSTAPGALRGMYVHRRHEDYLVLLGGVLTVGLVDLRADSATRGAACRITLDAPLAHALCVPRGVLHGWYATAPTTHLQAVSEPFGTYGVDDNVAVDPADPNLGLTWPGPIEHLVARDWTPLAELLGADADAGDAAGG